MLNKIRSIENIFTDGTSRSLRRLYQAWQCTVAGSWVITVVETKPGDITFISRSFNICFKSSLISVLYLAQSPRILLMPTLFGSWTQLEKYYVVWTLTTSLHLDRYLPDYCGWVLRIIPNNLSRCLILLKLEYLDYSLNLIRYKLSL